MLQRNRLTWFLAILCLLIALPMLTIALLPFEAMKMLLDHLSRDGNLSMLIPQNAIIFRFLIGMISLLFGGMAYITWARKWAVAGYFFSNSVKDCCSFFSLQKNPRMDQGFLLALFVIIIFAIVRRLALIESPMLHDEAYTVGFADTFFHAISDYSMPNNHVFHTILVYLSIHLWGYIPWVVRLPAFIAGVLLVPGVYFLAKQIYDPWTGILASLLVAFSPNLINHSTNARGYTLVALFTLISLTLGNYVLRKKNIFAWGLIGLFSALGFFTVPVMLFPFGILFTWLFLENLVAVPASYSSKREFFYYWLFAGVFTAILTILFYTPILIYTTPQMLLANSFVAPVAWPDLLETWHARLIETWTQWIFGVPKAIIILLGLGWMLALVFHRKISSVRIPLQLAAVLWIITLMIIQRYNAWERVWVFLLPLMIIWASAGVMPFLNKVYLKFAGRLSLAPVVVGALILIGGWSTFRLGSRLPELLAQRGDVENVTLFLENNLEDTDLVVVDWPDDAPLMFYFLEYDISFHHFDKRFPYNRAWIVVNPPDGQTIGSVLSDRGPDIPPLNLNAVELVQEFGTRQVFRCPIK